MIIYIFKMITMQPVLYKLIFAEVQVEFFHVWSERIVSIDKWALEKSPGWWPTSCPFDQLRGALLGIFCAVPRQSGL